MIKNPSIHDAVTNIVRREFDCLRVPARRITRLLEAKVAIEEGDTKSAMLSILEVIVRLSDDDNVKSVDDLTKLLNTTIQVRLDTGPFTLRELIKEGVGK